MDAGCFDTLLAALTSAPSRRAALRVLGGLGLTGLLNRTDIEAKKKHKKKKKCAKAGQTPGKKRKQCCAGLVRDGGVCRNPSSSPPSSPPPGGCVPTPCPPDACGSLPDGCGGTLNCGGCPISQICLRSNVCQPCSVTCTGTPADCGAALQVALEAGGTIHVCPGTYQHNFTLDDATIVIGAGEGDEAASNTILDAGGAGRVLRINTGVGPITLERLRLTGGSLSGLAANDGGAGIRHLGGTLRLTECTVSGNTTANSNLATFAPGGGIFIDAASTLELTRCTLRINHNTGPLSRGGGIYSAGTITLTDCLVEANIANSDGGGLYIGSGMATLAGTTRVRGNIGGAGGGILNSGVLAIAESCRVTENTSTAGPGTGGGIFNVNGAVTLAGAAPSPIVVNNCRENCAGNFAVPKCSATPVSC